MGNLPDMRPIICLAIVGIGAIALTLLTVVPWGLYHLGKALWLYSQLPT